MTGSYDPLDLAIFNSLGNLAFNVGSGFAEQYEESRNERLGKKAIQQYAEDPSLENYLNLSKFADIGSAIKASQALQQQKATQDLDQGINQLAQVMGIPPELARVLYENPKMAEFLTPPPEQGPLGHLSEDDLKSYNTHQEQIRTHMERGALAREMRMSGSRPALIRYAQETGMNASLIKKMSKKEIQEFGRKIEIQELTNAARKQVAMKLMEYKSLTPQERRAAEATILASPKFTSFLASELDATAQGSGIYSPHRIIDKTGQFIDNMLAEHEKNFLQKNGGRQPGRIAMPNYGNNQQGAGGGQIADQRTSSGGGGGLVAPPQEGQQQNVPSGQQQNPPSGQQQGTPQEDSKKKSSKDKEQPKGQGIDTSSTFQPVTPQSKGAHSAQNIPQVSPQGPSQPPKSQLEQIEQIQREAKEESKQLGEQGVDSFYPYPGQPETQPYSPAQGAHGQVHPTLQPTSQQKTPAAGQQAAPGQQQLPTGDQTPPMQVPGQEGAPQQGVQPDGVGSEHKSVLDLINDTLSQTEGEEEEEEGEFVPGSIEKLKETRPLPVAFKGSYNDFVEAARKYEIYDDWTDDDFKQVWDNFIKFSRVRKNYRNPETLPTYDEFKEGLRYGLIHDYFSSGVKPKEAEELANQTVNLFSDEHLMEVHKATYDNIKGFDDIVTLAAEGSKSLTQMPKEVAEKAATKLLDTFAVGGVDMAFAVLDQFPLTVTAMATAAAFPGAGTAIAAGIFIGAAAGQIYRYHKQMENDAFYSSFFSTPKTAEERRHFYEYRWRFAEKYEKHFTQKELERIADNDIKGRLEQKIRGLLNRQDFVEKSMDVMFRPASALDERYTHIKENVRNAHPNYDQTTVLAAEMFGSLMGGHLTYKGMGKLVGAPRIPPPGKVSIITQDGKTIPLKGTPKVTPGGVKALPKGSVAGATAVEEGAAGAVAKGGAGKVPVKGNIAGAAAVEEGVVESTAMKQHMNKTRKKLTNSVRGKDHVASSAEQQYNKHWDSWAKSKGQQAFQHFKQTGGWLKEYAPLRYAAISAAYGGVDYALEQSLDEPYFARCMANMGFGSVAAVVDYHFYRSRNASIQRNIQAEGDMFHSFSQDFGGTANTEKQGRVFDIPAVNKEITYTPEGTVIVKKSPNPPKNLPDGPVNFKEFNTVQSDNFISYLGVSNDLGVPVPDFTRTPASETTTIDTHSIQQYVQDTTNHKKLIIENARQQDLAPFVDPKSVAKVLGKDTYAPGEVPGTNDLKKLADTLYQEVDKYTKGPMPQKTLDRLKEGVTSMAYYFEDHPSLGASFGKGKTLFKDVQTNLFKETTTTKDLVDYHQMINKQKRNLQQVLTKEYSPDNQLLYDFYTALDTMILRSLPEQVSTALQSAENAYFAYKFSEKLDDVVKSLGTGDFNEWVSKGDQFQEKSKYIFDEFQDSLTSNALKKSMVHEDYFRRYVNKDNVEIVADGKVIKSGTSLNDFADINGAADGLRKATYFTPFGKSVGLASNIFGNLRNMNKVGIQRKAQQAMKSSDFSIGTNMRPLILASRKAHNLRKIRSPMDKRNAEVPEIVKKIDAYGKVRRKLERKKARELLKKQQEEEAKKNKLEEERDELKKALKDEKDLNKKNKEDFKRELKKMKIESDERIAVVKADANAKVKVARSEVDRAKTKLKEVKVRAGAKVKTAEIGLEKVKSSSEAKIITAESKAQEAIADASVKTEELRLRREETGLEREKVGLEKEQTGLQKEANKLTRQELNFKRKQDVSKTKYKNLSKQRRDLIQKATKTKSVGERNRLIKLIESVHNRIGNLRPYIEESIIEAFDLEHERAQDFLNKF